MSTNAPCCQLYHVAHQERKGTSAGNSTPLSRTKRQRATVILPETKEHPKVCDEKPPTQTTFSSEHHDTAGMTVPPHLHAGTLILSAKVTAV